MEDRFSKQLDSFNSALLRHTANADTILNSHGISAALAKSSQQQIKDQLPSMMSSAFGDHCLHPSSLYMELQRKLIPFLSPGVPHQSNFTQTINVRSFDRESIIWEEECGYRVHSIAHHVPVNGASFAGPPSPSVASIPFAIPYATRSIIGDIDSNEAFHERFSLLINVGQKVLFDSSKDLTYCPDSKKIRCVERVNFVVSNVSNGVLEISVNPKVELREEWTKIGISERNIIKDNSFTFRKTVPVYGVMVNVQLPSDWEFEERNFDNEDEWDTSGSKAWQLYADRKDKWVLPGMYLSCRWRRPEEGGAAPGGS